MEQYKQFLVDIYYTDDSAETIELSGLEVLDLSKLNQAIHQLGSKEKEIRTWILQPLLKLEN